MHRNINTDAIKKAVEVVGGINELAKKIGVSYSTIINWRNNRFSVSMENCLKIEKATNGLVKKEELLPDYPWNELK